MTFPKIRQKLEKIRSISVYGNKLELLEPPSSLMFTNPNKLAEFEHWSHTR